MARQPAEWTLQDWSLVCHAILRTRWQADLDEDRALELYRELGETKAVPVRELLEALHQQATLSSLEMVSPKNNRGASRP